jgi:type II restriction/modification system DNA methylase subunit YeeA
LKGNTVIALLAKRQRDLALLPNIYRESGFIYSEQTVKIWDIREFMANPKWKEEAVRKSEKRRARAASKTQLKISRKRFRSFIDNWYRNSLKEAGEEAPAR